jgi:hypothetical protein
MGHPFCLMTARNRIVIVSGGPETTTPFACDNLRITKSEILAFRQSPFQR